MEDPFNFKLLISNNNTDHALDHTDGLHHVCPLSKLKCLMLLLQHKRSRQLADYAKEAAGMNQEQLFQLLLQVRSPP